MDSLKQDLIMIPEFLKGWILLVHGFYTFQSENVYYVDDSSKSD